MLSNSEYNRLKNEVSKNDSIKEDGIRILGEISDFVNTKEWHSKGRDLVIRALAVRDQFGLNEQQVLNALVRAVGLFPYMDEADANMFGIDRVALEYHRSTTLGGKIFFHSLQGRIFRALSAGHNVILSASTSVGKSLLIDALIASGKHKNVVIVLPTIALIDETRKRLFHRFSKSFKLITHQSQNPSHDLDKGNIFILTQERVLARSDFDQVDLFVIDEFYKLDIKIEADPSRAVDLNLAFKKLSAISRQFYMLGPNIKAIQGLDSYSHVFIDQDFSTVAVDVKNFNLPCRGDARLNKLIELCDSLNGSTMIYCQSPPSAQSVAHYMLEKSNLALVSDCASAVAWIEKNYDPAWIVARALAYGIGIHHASVPRALQQYIIEAFNQQKIKFLICTSTIIEGINTSAENIIIFDRRKSTNLIDHFTYKNIEGRAGRMGKYFIGKVFCLETPPEPNDFVVTVPIGEQDENTPIALIANLPKDELTAGSIERLSQIEANGFLSLDVIARNKLFPAEDQINIAREISRNIAIYEEAFSWNTIPDGHQLRVVCNIIFNYLETKSLYDIKVLTGDSLAWHIQTLQRTKNPTKFLKEVIKGDLFGRTIDQIISHSLSFLRNIACYRFPQQLRMIDDIQKDVFFRKNKNPPGNFQAYASMVEHMFIDSALVALDDYGLPIQLALKLEKFLEPDGNLDKALSHLKAFEPKGNNFDEFELSLISTIKSNF